MTSQSVHSPSSQNTDLQESSIEIEICNDVDVDSNGKKNLQTFHAAPSREVVKNEIYAKLVVDFIDNYASNINRTLKHK